MDRTAQPRIPRLTVITDTVVQDRLSHEALAAAALAGGADGIQLRDKRMSPEELRETAARLAARCREAGAVFVVDDHPEIARDAGADGVHVGRGDAPVARARDVVGAGAIVGASAATPEEARRAQDAGADYVGVGHVFPTTSKHKPGPPIGLDGLERVCRAVSIPVVAIGGVHAGNVREVLARGAWGVAVIAAVCAADDPRRAAAALRAAAFGPGAAPEGVNRPCGSP